MGNQTIIKGYKCQNKGNLAQTQQKKFQISPCATAISNPKMEKKKMQVGMRSRQHKLVHWIGEARTTRPLSFEIVKKAKLSNGNGDLNCKMQS